MMKNMLRKTAAAAALLLAAGPLPSFSQVVELVPVSEANPTVDPAVGHEVGGSAPGLVDSGAGTGVSLGSSLGGDSLGLTPSAGLLSAASQGVARPWTGASSVVARHEAPGHPSVTRAGSTAAQVPEALVAPERDRTAPSIDVGGKGVVGGGLVKVPEDVPAGERARLDEMFDHSGAKAKRAGFVPSDDAEEPAPRPAGWRTVMGFRQGGDREEPTKPNAPLRKRARVGFSNQPLEETPAKKTNGERTLLLTGFGPFHVYESNVSQAVAERLDGMLVQVHEGEGGSPGLSISGKDLPPPETKGKLLASYRIVSKILPNSFDRSAEMVESLIKEHEPEILLMLGQSGRTPKFEVETMAKNIVHSPVVADADGAKPQMEYALARGPAGHATTAPAADLVNWLNQNGVDALLSPDAGTNVCNSAFYFALNAAYWLGTGTMVSFVHLPPAVELLTEAQVKVLPHWGLNDVIDSAAKMAQWFGWAHDTVDKKGKAAGAV